MEKVVSCFISKATLDYVKLHCDQEFPLLFKELDPEIDHLPDPETFLCDPHQCHLMAPVVGSGQPAYIGDLKQLALHPDDILHALGEDSVYIIPLANGTKVIGVLPAGSGNGRETSLAIRETLEMFPPILPQAVKKKKGPSHFNAFEGECDGASVKIIEFFSRSARAFAAGDHGRHRYRAPQRQ